MKRLALLFITLVTLGAATPALAGGWYLMEPPQMKGNDGLIMFPEKSAPLSEWSINDSFETAAECKAGRDQEIAKRYDMLNTIPSAQALPEKVKFAVKMGAIMETCVATDDPRLGR